SRKPVRTNLIIETQLKQRIGSGAETNRIPLVIVAVEPKISFQHDRRFISRSDRQAGTSPDMRLGGPVVSTSRSRITALGVQRKSALRTPVGLKPCQVFVIEWLRHHQDAVDAQAGSITGDAAQVV